MSILVSVIMPAFNADAFIGDAIKSVQQQTVRDWELIIVDDDSSDKTREIAEDFARTDERVRIVANGWSRGAAGARNTGITAAQGRYLAFLDSDDMWKPQKLQRQLDVMKSGDVVLCFTAYRKLYEGMRFGHNLIEVPLNVSYADLLKSNVIGCSTAMYDCESLGKVYFPDVSRRQDLGLWLRILKRIGHEDYGIWLKILRNSAANTPKDRIRGGRAIGINEDLVSYRVHTNSLSSNKFKAAIFQWFIYRDVEGLSIWASSFYFFHYMMRGLRKYMLD